MAHGFELFAGGQALHCKAPMVSVLDLLLGDSSCAPGLLPWFLVMLCSLCCEDACVKPIARWIPRIKSNGIGVRRTTLR